jgi:hypothetical protein
MSVPIAVFGDRCCRQLSNTYELLPTRCQPSAVEALSLLADWEERLALLTDLLGALLSTTQKTASQEVSSRKGELRETALGMFLVLTELVKRSPSKRLLPCQASEVVDW